MCGRHRHHRGGRGQHDRDPVAAQHGRPDQDRGDLRGNGQPQQRATDHRPPPGTGSRENEQRRGGQERGRDVDVRVARRLQRHRRAPRPQHRQTRVQPHPPQTEDQQYGGRHREEGRRQLDRPRPGPGRRCPVDDHEQQLRHRRIDRVHRRPVDERTAGGQRAPVWRSDCPARRTRRRSAATGRRRAAAPVPGRRGRSGTGRSGRLDPAVPDVAVQVVAAARRAEPGRQLEHHRATENEHDGGPHRQPTAQDGARRVRRRSDRQRQQRTPAEMPRGRHPRGAQRPHENGAGPAAATTRRTVGTAPAEAPRRPRRSSAAGRSPAEPKPGNRGGRRHAPCGFLRCDYRRMSRTGGRLRP